MEVSTSPSPKHGEADDPIARERYRRRPKESPLRTWPQGASDQSLQFSRAFSVAVTQQRVILATNDVAYYPDP